MITDLRLRKIRKIRTARMARTVRTKAKTTLRRLTRKLSV